MDRNARRPSRTKTTADSEAEADSGGARDPHHRILQALRRIMRRVETSSRELEVDYGVTAPQLICLMAIVHAGSITQIELSDRVHLSASTLVGVIDRLAAKKLVRKQRDRGDRRRINLSPTERGAHMVRDAPPPLQETLLKGLGELSQTDLLSMARSLDRLVDLLEARDVANAPPMLAPGPIPKLDV